MFLMSSQSIPFLNARLPGVPLNPHDVTGTLNGDREGVRVNYKLEQLIIQTKIRREVQISVSSVPYQTREVRVWQPKREAHQAGASEV